jgi:hypothetical protein
MGGSFGGRRRVQEPSDRWEAAVRRDHRLAADMDVDCGGKEQRRLEEEEWRGHGPKNGPKHNRRRRRRRIRTRRSR